MLNELMFSVYSRWSA